MNPEKSIQHSKRSRAMHYQECPKCHKRFSDLVAHYQAKHRKADRKALMHLKEDKS